MSTNTRVPKRRSRPSLLRRPLFIVLMAAVAGAAALFALATFSGNSSAASGGAPIEARGAPKLKTSQEKIEFGNVKLGRTVEAKFLLTNVGDQPLKIAEAPFVEILEGC